MPYIKPDDRKLYTDSLIELGKAIGKQDTKKESCIQKVIVQLIHRSYDYDLKYNDHNEIVGMLSCCSREWQRRFHDKGFYTSNLISDLSPSELKTGDFLVSKIANTVRSIGMHNKAGQLNYVITMLILLVYGNPKQLTEIEHEKVIGIIEGVADMWYENLTAPYEDLKIQENTDLI